MKFFEAGKHISWVILTSANLSKSAWLIKIKKMQ
jgi:hypothetical protein